jgi:hypothetical protein
MHHVINLILLGLWVFGVTLWVGIAVLSGRSGSPPYHRGPQVAAAIHDSRSRPARGPLLGPGRGPHPGVVGVSE